MINVLEKWRILNSEHIKPNMYAISCLGRIMNIQTNYILSPRKNNTNDYLVIGLIADDEYHTKYRIHLLHRLVAIYFCPGRSVLNNTVNHINGDKTLNTWYNLEWVSQSENNQKAKELGLNTNFGVGHYQSKLSETQVHRICALLNSGYSYSEILRDIGLIPNKNNNELIGNIKRGRTYTSISKQYFSYE